ncbi:hypothetical protein KC725_05345 [Candidatus Peregrinibacteria bacterium]|nr:hypothetical protein [Candidatus Peregrinibacteria bacterium]
MKKFIAVSAFCLLAFAGCSSGAPSGGETPEKAVAIAKCLEDKGVEMYGAFWCPHCKDQKKAFGSQAEEFIPYNECDARGENEVSETCIELEIEGYPTWIFTDGSREERVLPLTELQEISGCSDAEIQKYNVTSQE